MPKNIILTSLLALLIGCSSGDEDSVKEVKSQSEAGSVQTELESKSDLSGATPAPATDEEKYQSIDFSVSDISEETYQGRIAVAVSFSNPVPLDQPLSEWLSIKTSSGESVSGSWVANKEGSRLFFPGLEPETFYHISVLRGLPSQLDKKLDKDYRQSLTTKEITPMLGFVSQGHFLAHKLTDGLPVIAVNAHQVDVDFYRVPESDIASFIADHGTGNTDFWRIRDELPEFELAYTGRFDLESERNEQAKRFLPIKGIEELQSSGVYVAVMRKSGEYRYDYPVTWFAVTDLGVHLRVYDGQIDVMVNSLATAEAVADVELTLLNNKGIDIASQQTSPDGVATFQLQDLEEKDSPALLIATQGNDTTIVRFNTPALDLSEFPVEGFESGQQTLFLYSSRDLYRPGEQVTVSGLLRGNDGAMISSPTLNAKLMQPDGRVVAEQRLAANALNYYAANFSIASDAPTGEWRISVNLADQTSVDYAFWVEDFLPERMTLDLTGEEALQPEDDLEVKVQSNYLYGAPAAGNTLKSRLITALEPHPFAEFKDFYFGHVQHTELNKQFELEDRKLDAEGSADLSVPSSWDAARSPLKLKLFASVQDTGGRPVSRSFTSMVLPNDTLLGIRPLFVEDTTDYGASAPFELIFTDGKNRLANDQVDISLIREHRRYYWVYSDSDGWTNSYTERHYPVFQQTISIEDQAVAKFEAPVEWGYYRIEAKDKQTGLVSSYRFRAGWSEDSQTLSGRPDRIGISLDKAAYDLGDTAVVRLKPPAAGKGYLLVEADKPLYWQPIEVSAAGGQFEIPLDESWERHDLYVSVVLIQPGKDRDSLLPRRMMGIHPLKLDRENRRLNVEIESQPRVFPEQQVEIPIKVSSSTGELPKQVQLTLSAVDLGVLNISQFKTPDPFTGFFGQRRYQVASRDNYGELIESDQGKSATLRFGGDADLERGGDQPASDVQIISLFSGVVDVDESGLAKVPLYFPDFNGRVRLMAVAFSDDAFGSADKELQVAAPVVTQLTMPRFMAYGDRSELALDVHNLSGHEQTLELELALGKGLQIHQGDAKLTELKNNLSLKVDEKKTLYIPIESTLPFAASSISLTITGLKALPEGAKDIISRTWHLGSRPAWSPVERVWNKALAKDEMFRLPLDNLPNYQEESTWLTLNVGSRPPLDVAAHLRELKAYPYGCLEQTTSGVFASLYANAAALAELGLQGETDQERSTAMNMAIQRLLGMQKSNGSFGLWSAQSREEYWLTVYVADFLLRAKSSGYAVPEANMQKTIKRLQAYVRNPRWISSHYGSENEVLRFAVQAYAGQVLAGINQVPLSDLRTLYSDRGEGSTGLSLLQLGLALDQAGDPERAATALQEASVALNAGEYASVEYGSRIRDLALALFWAVEAKQPSAYWEPLLYKLTDTLQDRRWFSTQERNSLFLAGWALQSTKAGDLNLNLMTWKDQHLVNGQSSLVQRYSLVSVEQGLAVENLSDQTAFLSASLKGYTVQPPQAVSQGVDIRRRYLDMQGEPLSFNAVESESEGKLESGLKNKAVPVLEAKAGDLVLVELTVAVDKPLHHLLVVDLLPAGLELENQNLATAYELSDVQVSNQSIVETMGDLDIRHQEFRADRYVAAINMEWEKTAKLYYLARVVSPGMFTIPPTFAEDMYRPEIRHTGAAAGRLVVVDD